MLTAVVHYEDKSSLNCAEGIYPKIFISSLIFRNCLIYHDVGALLHMKELKIDFPELKRQTHVVFLIIKSLWLDDDYNLTKRGVNYKQVYRKNLIIQIHNKMLNNKLPLLHFHQ